MKLVKLSFSILERLFIAYPDTEKEWHYDISHCYSLLEDYEKAKEVGLKSENEMWKYRALVIAEYGLGDIEISNNTKLISLIQKST